MKKILFVANYFPPISGPGAIRPYYFAKYLGEAGNNVTVLSAADDHVYGTDSSLNTDIENVEVLRFGDNDFSKFSKRLFKWRLFFPFFFMFPLTFFERHRVWSFKARTWLENNAANFDLIYVTTGPFSSALVTSEIAQRLKVPFVLDMRDPFSLSPARIWPSYFHWKMFSNLERKLIQSSNKTVVVADGMKDELLEHHPVISNDKIEVIYNGYDGDLSNRKEPTYSDEKIKICYAGSLHDYSGEDVKYEANKYAIPYKRESYNTRTRSLFYFIQGLKMLPSSERNKIELNVFGKHAIPKTIKLIKEFDLEDQIVFRGKVPFAEIHEEFKMADVLFFPMEERVDGGRSYFLSGKVFEYIQANRPVFAIGSENEITDKLRDLDVLTFRSESNADSVKASLEQIISMKKERTLLNPTLNKNALLRFQRKHQASQLLQIIDGASKG